MSAAEGRWGTPLQNVFFTNSYTLPSGGRDTYTVPLFALSAPNPTYTCGSSSILEMDDAWNELSFDFEPAVQAALPPASLGNTRDRFRTQVQESHPVL